MVHFSMSKHNFILLQLIGELGGSLGMFLGISLISFYQSISWYHTQNKIELYPYVGTEKIVGRGGPKIIKGRGGENMALQGGGQLYGTGRG